MKGLFYLVTHRMKNSVIAFFKHPGKLVLVLLFVALLGMSLLSGNAAEGIYGDRDIRELFALGYGLYTVFLCLTAYNGFSTGSAMFSMPDVNLLFDTPIRPKRILLYGLVRQLGLALVICVFMLYYYGMLHQAYLIPFWFLVVIVLLFGGVIFVSQLLAMLIYARTSANDRLKNRVRAVFFGVILLLVVCCCGWVWVHGLSLESLLTFCTGVGRFFPVSGWMAAAMQGIFTGAWLPAVLGITGTVALATVLILVISRTDSDYYEDVLRAAEVAQSAIAAKKEFMGAEMNRKNVKVGKTGLDGGKGASAIYFKQKLENRRGRVLLVDLLSLIMILITLGVSVFLYYMEGSPASESADASVVVEQAAVSETLIDDAEAEADDMDASTLAMIVALSTSVYTQLFSVSAGRANRELTKPFIYMIPDTPFRKLLACMRSSLRSFLLEGILLWVPLLFLCKVPVAGAVAGILSRVSFGYLFLSVDVLILRFFSGWPKAFATVFYLLGAMLATVPGILLAVFLTLAAGMLFPMLPELVVALGIMVLANAGLTALLTFASRNMLACAELNYQ